MIKISNVNKSFLNKEVLKNINLTINPNELTFIVGTSGSGKTTLLNLIGGLDNVSSGEIIYNDMDIKDNLSKYRSENVGFIFQDYNLIAGLSVQDNINLGIMYSKRVCNKNDIDAQIDKFDLKYKNQVVETLSGGEKQRVAIIRSICKEADIILADEPTGNLDVVNSERVIESLVEMKENKHIIVITHDLELAKKYGDRIITLSDGEVISDSRSTINDSIITKKVSNQENTKKKVSWKSIKLLGINSFKKRYSKIISIALVVGLAITAIALLYDFKNFGNNLSDDVNVNYLENDLVSLFYSYDANMGYKETPFTDSIVNTIKKEHNSKEIVPIYMERDTWFFSVGSNIKKATIKQINIDDFFENRIMSYEIKGRFLKEKDEIILASDVAKELYKDNPIGKSLYLNDGSGQQIKLKIVGINNTVNPFDEIYTFVSSEKIKELLVKGLELNLTTRMEINEYNTTEKNEDVIVTSGGIYAPMESISGNEEILYRNPPQNDNEILISKALLPYAISGLNIDSNYTEQEGSELDIDDDLINKLTSKSVALKHNGLFKLKISGIYNDNEIGIKFKQNLIKDLKEIEPTILDLYLPQETDIIDFKDNINKTEKYTCLLKLEDLKNKIIEQTGYFKLTILVMGLIMIIVSIAMLSSFSKIVVLERRKEIAIIKSLGGTDREVLFTLWFDAMVISGIAFIVSTITTFFVVTIIPNVFKNISYVKMNYPIFNLGIIGIIFAAIIFIYTFLSFNKLIRKMPAELLKN